MRLLSRTLIFAISAAGRPFPDTFRPARNGAEMRFEAGWSIYLHTNASK